MALSGVGKQVTSELTNSCSASRLGGTKNNQPSSSKPRESTTHSGGPGPSGCAVGGSSWDPNEPRQVSHLAMYISDDDEFTDDPHQIIPIEDAFALPYLPRQNFEGFNHGYLLPAEVTGFQRTFYHKSGDVRPGYTGAFPWVYHLDCQGHMASKLHSGVAAYSSYIGLVSTRIVYPQQENPDVKIGQYSYFDNRVLSHFIIGTSPPPNHHFVWGCLHFFLWYQMFFWLNMTQGHSCPI